MIFELLTKQKVFFIAETTTDRRAGKVKKDTWSKKKWYTIMSPEFLGGKEIADTLALKEKDVIGRSIVLPLSELTGNFRDFKVKVSLRVKSVKGNEAHTEYVGQELLRDQILRVIRRWSSRIDSVDDITLKDSAKFRIKSLTVSARRINTSTKDEIRHAVSRGIKEYVSARTTDQVVGDINCSKLQKTIVANVRKIYPIRTIEVRMIQKI